MDDQERLNRYNAEARPIREAIDSRPLTDFYELRPSKGGGYECPLCGSGTGPHGTGALFIRGKDNRVTCFSGGCFGEKGRDTLGALRLLMPDKSEREIFSYCGYQMNGSSGMEDEALDWDDVIEFDGYGKTSPTLAGEPTPKAVQSEKPKTQPTPKAEVPADFKADIEKYAAALPGSEGEAYLKGRGFTVETINRFRLGYDAASRCVTIPYNPGGTYYGRRSVDPRSRIPHENLKDVPMPLFNPAALYSSDVCFVVESPLCAISIEQAGGSAVALSGTNGRGRLMEQLKKRTASAALVVCLDNDKAGREAAAKLGDELEKLGVFCVDGASYVMGEENDPTNRKDPNDVLRYDGPEALRKAVENAAEETRRQRDELRREAEEERRRRTGAGMVDAFLESVKTRKYEPIPTGIGVIDKALGGGFMRQQLVLLGAAPGAGKTALAQWIFENMAKAGISCVFLNLEMSREQILARTFSRLTARRGNRIPTNIILQGFRWTEEQERAVMAAADEYKRTIAPRIVYNPDGITANLDDILKYIEGEARQAEAEGAAAPLVVLDYLQIVRGGEREDAASVIKRSVFELKDYAKRHNTLVFVIIAHNRQSNSSGAVTMESGRDTSALEYSADLQLALTFTKCLAKNLAPKEKPRTPDSLTAEERKLVTLRIVKGRFGGVGREVDLKFDGETMAFDEIPDLFSADKQEARLFL